MAQNQDNRYRDLNNLVDSYHEKNRKRLKISRIVLILLPIILGLIRWLTDSDKIVFLIIWIFCMFAISAYLVGVEYLDETVQKKFDPETAEDAEEGEDQ